MIEGPAEWIGTKVSFELKQEGDYSIVLFKHLDWKEPVEFMHHCSTKWATFLMSLKALVETGKGAAQPGRRPDQQLGTEAGIHHRRLIRRKDVSEALYRRMRLRRDPL